MAPTLSLEQTIWCLPLIDTNIPDHLKTLVLSVLLLVFLMYHGLSLWAFLRPAGPAWRAGRDWMGRVQIPGGPPGLPVLGSLLALRRGLAHRTLAAAARSTGARRLMALSLGSTPVVVASDPSTAHEILASPHFADRPIKQSARLLLFSRAIGFAPSGSYWRLLRKIAATHLFSPRRILAHEPVRMLECTAMVHSISKDQASHGVVTLRKHLQAAALNNIMGSVFGKRYEFFDKNKNDHEARELQEMVREGFELLGAFNWCDHLPWLKYFYDPCRIVDRCSNLVPRVHALVKKIIHDHRDNRHRRDRNSAENSDFVDVLLSLEGEEKLHEDDMVAILWEMIFRGTDTIALLIEWIMAELVLHQGVQSKLRAEIDAAVESGAPILAIAKLPYLQAVVKETLRLHPPGPLLSWARLATSDVPLSNGMVVPKGTTAMVNMWSITHDPDVWDDPLTFNPDRFVESAGGLDVDVRGTDLRLAPFGAGRRVCPGKDLGLVTVSQWVAMLVGNFNWVPHGSSPVDLSEVLKLSCEMKNPLATVALPRKYFGTKIY